MFLANAKLPRVTMAGIVSFPKANEKHYRADNIKLNCNSIQDLLAQWRDTAQWFFFNTNCHRGKCNRGIFFYYVLIKYACPPVLDFS